MDEDERPGVRRIRALWRTPAPVRPGPNRGLDLDSIVDAAVELADADGLGKLSIRRVASSLGISTMSIYTHVENKEALLELMTDRVNGELAGDPPPSDDWRACVETMARENLELLLEHPWLVEQPPSRPPLGPGTIGKYERELGLFSALDVDDVSRDAALAFVLGFVRGVAHDRLASLRATGSDATWWSEQADALAAVMPADRYPLSVRVGAAVGEATNSAWSPDTAFEFGLARVLDGLAALLDEPSTQ